jgi:hypothetical protein
MGRPFLFSLCPHYLGMTLDKLAQAMRGMPRDALIMIRTPQGLREVRLVKPGYIRDDGEPGMAGTGARYAIVLDDNAWEPIGDRGRKGAK